MGSSQREPAERQRATEAAKPERAPRRAPAPDHPGALRRAVGNAAVAAVHDGGTPLPDDVRRTMEQSFAGVADGISAGTGAARISEPGDAGEREAAAVANHVTSAPGGPGPGPDFGPVRIHTGPAADAAARSMSAAAYTVGDDIAFAAGRYQPGTPAGRALVAHELAHVVQQRRQGALAIQRAPNGDPPEAPPAPPVLGGHPGTTGTVRLYHYGDLENRETFSSPPGYPRLTDYDQGVSQQDAADHTGAPVTANLRYKYELTIDQQYFEKNFRDMGTRKSYSEFGTLEKIPVRYFRRVATLTVSGSGGGGGPIAGGQAPPGAGAGGGGQTSLAKRAGAGAALVILGASVALNSLIERGNARRIQEQFAAREPELAKEQQENPTLGFLVALRFSGGGAGLEGTTASARFESLSWQRGYTRSETEARWNSTPRFGESTYEFVWIDPLVTPSPSVVATPFEKVALARFADISRIGFQKVQFKEWGGFDTNGVNGPIDATKWRRTDARSYRFLVLRMPPRITIRNVVGRPATKDVRSVDVQVAGGSVPAVDLGDATAVAVWPAEAATEELFAHTDRVSDKEGKLSPVVNIDRVRWLRPAQVQVVTWL